MHDSFQLPSLRHKNLFDVLLTACTDTERQPETSLTESSWKFERSRMPAIVASKGCSPNRARLEVTVPAYQINRVPIATDDRWKEKPKGTFRFYTTPLEVTKALKFLEGIHSSDEPCFFFSLEPCLDRKASRR